MYAIRRPICSVGRRFFSVDTAAVNLYQYESTFLFVTVCNGFLHLLPPKTHSSFFSGRKQYAHSATRPKLSCSMLVFHTMLLK
jgi:hypothetical protein